MKNTMLKIALGVVMAGGCISAAAQSLDHLRGRFKQTVTEGKGSHQIDIDNDSLLLNKDDGFYTSGLRYTRGFSLRDKGALQIAGWRIGQELYTASDIKLPAAQIAAPDHPYAAWLYAGIFSHAFRADGTYTKLGLDFGCLGPCAGGEWSQKSLHKLFNQPLPEAWETQVKNEVGLVLHGDIAPVRWSPTTSIDMTPHVFWRFGNIFADAGAGATLRMGRLNQLPDQPALFGFIRADGRAVAYNATLQGGYFSHDNFHTVNPKRLVGEAEIGIVWQQGQYGISASLVRRSNEIDGLSGSVGRQNFARLQFTYIP